MRKDEKFHFKLVVAIECCSARTMTKMGVNESREKKQTEGYQRQMYWV